MSNFFRFGNLELPYLIQHDGEHIGERRIEVPIALEWAFQQNAHVEVGAVLPYHLKEQTGDVVIDPYDPHPAVTHAIDAETFDFTGQSVLSISTIEHIGQGEYGGEFIDLHKASRVLQKIVREAQTYLITVPAGYHLALDAFIAGSGLPTRFMRQISPDNQWEPCGEKWFAKSVYNHPLPYANVVAFLSNSFEWAAGAAS